MEKGITQAQTEQVFARVIKDNQAKIYRICRIYAVAPLEPKDLFQEVVFHIWKSLPSFKSQSNISTWVYRIALNVCIRSKMKLQKQHEKIIRLESLEIIAAAEKLDDDKAEKYRALQACIKSLNEADQSIVILYLEELAYKEIALITGLTENHIAVKMKRIRKKLFDCITLKMN